MKIANPDPDTSDTNAPDPDIALDRLADGGNPHTDAGEEPWASH